jgi:hypothetical protein
MNSSLKQSSHLFSIVVGELRSPTTIEKEKRLKQKSRPKAAISVSKTKRLVLGSLCQRADAARAERLLDQPAVLQNRNLLEVRAEGAAGSALGEAAVVTKNCALATLIAFHCQDPFTP